MQDNIQSFKDHVVEISANPDFLHHKWFVRWHLEIVARLSVELTGHYPEADKELVEVMAWLHDYGKIIDFDHQYDRKNLDQGRDKLIELGFASEFANRAADYIEALDKKDGLASPSTPIEVRIVSSADGCAHLVGPFMHLFWNFETDKNFVGRTLDELMTGNLRKADKDWTLKIVLPEARKAFEARHMYMRELSGELPPKFFS